MNEIQKDYGIRTPIEKALQIDENGMTTAKKLYEFLKLGKNNYSRWYRTNILENQFAELDVDFFPFLLNEECGGQMSQDCKITAHFAKKLCMVQKSQRGEEAREYFAKAEDFVKQTVMSLGRDNNPMKLLEMQYEAIKYIDQKTDRNKQDIDTLKSEINELKYDIPIFSADEKKLSNIVRRRASKCMGGCRSNAFKDKSLRRSVLQFIYGEVHRQLEISSCKFMKRGQFGTAVEIVKSWEPDGDMQDRIDMCNAQISIFVK